MHIPMRAVMLALALTSATGTDVLAQTVGAGRPAAPTPTSDGPLFVPAGPPHAVLPPDTSTPAASPPVITLPDVPGPPAAPSASRPGQKPLPRLFRRPAADGDPTSPSSTNSPSTKRLLPGKWTKRSPQPTDAPEFAPGIKPEARNIPSTPVAPATPPKRLLTPRKYGPVELFPAPRNNDQTSSGSTSKPFFVRRPVLAW